MSFGVSSAYPDMPDPDDQKKAEEILTQIGLHPVQQHLQAQLTQAAPVTPPAITAPAASPTLVKSVGTPDVAPPMSESLGMPTTPGATPIKLPGPNRATPPIIRTPTPQETNSINATTAAQQERARLISTGSGISQIKNPFLRGLARVGDIAGTALFPGVAAEVPGTELHHNILVNQATHRANQGLAEQKEEAATADIQAQEPLREAQTYAALHPELAIGKTPEEKAQADLMAQVNPETGKNYTASEAFAKLKEEEQNVKPDNKDRQLTRYAELRNKQSANTQLTPAEQTEFNTLQTKYSVGPQGAVQYEGSIMRELGVNPKTAVKTLPPDLKVNATDTDAEAKEKLARAQALVSGATGQQRISISNEEAENPYRDWKAQNPGKSVEEYIAATAGAKSEAAAAATQTKLAQAATQAVNNMSALAKQDTDAANYAFLMNFIGISYEGVRGARLNRAEIERAALTRSLPDKLQHLYDLWVEKKILTPQQKQDMLQAAKAIEGTYKIETAPEHKGEAPKEGATKVNSSGDKVKFHQGKWVPE